MDNELQQQEQVRVMIDQLVRNIMQIDNQIAALELQRAQMVRELNRLTAAVTAD